MSNQIKPNNTIATVASSNLKSLFNRHFRKSNLKTKLIIKNERPSSSRMVSSLTISRLNWSRIESWVQKHTSYSLSAYQVSVRKVILLEKNKIFKIFSLDSYSTQKSTFKSCTLTFSYSFRI